MAGRPPGRGERRDEQGQEKQGRHPQDGFIIGTGPGQVNFGADVSLGLDFLFSID
jgi:hypothetical protein